ncbi:MAG: hypothetical protein AABX25_00470 [Nanoarchaeota archaeon]
MSETAIQRQILNKLDRVEKNMNYILEYIEDSRLTDDEKQLLQASYKHEKEGKLISGKDLKKKLGI